MQKLLNRFIIKPLTEKLLEKPSLMSYEKLLPSLEEEAKRPLTGTPVDYGFSNFENVTFTSENAIVLKGVFIPATQKSSKTFVLIHGRTSNHLRPMRYLKALNKIPHFTETYNIFLPDLRNAGKSTATPTFFGYKSALDVIACLDFLATTYHQTSFMLMGSSMGSMAILYTNYLLSLNKPNYTIEKIILDSPLSNVRKTILYSAKRNHKLLPTPIIKAMLVQFDKDIHHSLDRLSLATLSHFLPCSTLILQSETDTVTPIDILQEELSHAKMDYISTHIFPQGQHVMLYRENPEDFETVLSQFIQAKQ